MFHSNVLLMFCTIHDYPVVHDQRMKARRPHSGLETISRTSSDSVHVRIANTVPLIWDLCQEGILCTQTVYLTWYLEIILDFFLSQFELVLLVRFLGYCIQVRITDFKDIKLLVFINSNVSFYPLSLTTFKWHSVHWKDWIICYKLIQ